MRADGIRNLRGGSDGNGDGDGVSDLRAPKARARGTRCRRESEFPSEPNDKIADKLKSERVMPETIRGSLVDERDHRPVQ